MMEDPLTRILDDEADSETKLSLKKQARIECRAFRRLFSTPDGQLALQTMKRDIGWDEAGPPDQDNEHPVHHWLGQRSVIRGIYHKISLGVRLSDHPNQTDDE